MNIIEKIVWGLWLVMGSLLIGLILASPVMRADPGHRTMSATAYFGDGQ